MRRTYRSKKEIGESLDPRDVILTTDSKSSIFEAFYIQNIKQTKRILSAGSSMFAASNKVRKRRKYVKRVKELKSPPRESNSNSAYLTPDKSIHVKRPLDPFDMLLNSSTNENSESENGVRNLYQTKQKRQMSGRQKRQHKRKVNYCSNINADSDKENSNSSNESHSSQNTSSVLSHQLLIEKDSIFVSRNIDKSIDNISKQLLLLKKPNNEVTLSPVNFSPIRNRKESLFRTSIKHFPLCSTPFNKKNKRSFLKDSPISIIYKYDLSPQNGAENYDNKEMDKNKESVVVNDFTFNSGTYANVHDDQTNVKQSVLSNISSNHEESCSPILHSNVSSRRNKHSSSLLQKIQTSEVEPFIGFSINTLSEIEKMEAFTNKYKKLEHKYDTTIISKEHNKTSLDGIKIQKEEKNYEEHSYVENLNKTSSSLDYSLNNTERDTSTNKSIIEISSPESSEAIKIDKEKNDSEHNTNYNNTISSLYSTNGDSLYDTCNGDDDDFASDSEIDNTDLLCITERLNESVLQKNNEQKDDCSVQSDKTDSNYCLIDNENKPEIKSIDNVDIYESNLQEDSMRNKSIFVLSMNDCDTDNTISEEDNSISFVTTRKRNEITKDSFIYSLENSFSGASSSDSEKTVLSSNINSIDIITENNDITLVHKNQVEYESAFDLENCYNKDILEKETFDIESNNMIDNKFLKKSECSTKNILKPPFKTSKICKSPTGNISTNNIKIDNETLGNSFVLLKTIAPRLSSQFGKDVGTKQSSFVTENNTWVHSTDKPSCSDIDANDSQIHEIRQSIVLQPGKRWERSLSIYRRMTTMVDNFDHSILDCESLSTKGRKYRQSIISTMEMQDHKVSLHNVSIKSHRSTFSSKPSRSTIKILRESNTSELSVFSTTVSDDLQGFLTEDCDDTIVELSKLSIADSEHEVTVLEKFNDTSNRITTARDYVLRRCNQTDVILFDECYPDTVLKNCHKIGEGVYGEVFLWRAGDGRARVLKIVPIAGTVKVNGENQKDFNEIISEIVIAMELSALRVPIADIDKHLDEGKGVETLDLHSVENATDVFNEVLAVHCVYGSYPSRLLDLWDLYDECKGSENDNPAILPVDQQFLVLELANAGQDLESYQFNNAEQAFSLFKQVAFGLAVAEEAFQFEHRDLHWGNVLISPTDQKYATFVVGGRAHRVARRGVAATIIDYSLSRLSLRLPSDSAALYNDLAGDDGLFDAVGDYQFEVYRLMRDKLGNDWKNYEPYTNILWLHYTVDKMITALRYSRTNTKIHKHYIAKLKEIKNRILVYGSAVQYVLTNNEL